MSTPSIEPVVVTMTFDAIDASALAPVLAHYAVVSRGHAGCRNLDLCASAIIEGRFVIVQKWESADAQRAHFDSEAMVTMAEACRGQLSRPPEIDLLDPISAHDLA